MRPSLKRGWLHMSHTSPVRNMGYVTYRLSLICHCCSLFHAAGTSTKSCMQTVAKVLLMLSVVSCMSVISSHVLLTCSSFQSLTCILCVVTSGHSGRRRDAAEETRGVWKSSCDAGRTIPRPWDHYNGQSRQLFVQKFGWNVLCELQILFWYLCSADRWNW